MDLRQSRYFVAIVQRGSITRASLRFGYAAVEEG
jgi:DNA-binding transcriptional LysR family regulator